MGPTSDFTAVTIVNNHVFSWVFIVDWILALVLIIFMIFYFNRLIGWTISFLIRWYLWRAYHAQLEFQSFQISLLGGRVFFKNLSYVGTNEAICVVQGSFTWRYWLFQTRDSLIKDKIDGKAGSDGATDGTGSTSGTGSSATATGGGGATTTSNGKAKKFPARLVFDVTGVEWFVFNRTAAYDALFDLAKKGKGAGDIRSSFSSMSNTTPTDTSSSTSTTTNSSLSPDFMFKFFPIEVRFNNKGAMVIGNRATPSLLILHFASGLCSIDASPASSPLDQYKIVYNLKMIKPILEMRSNIDYKGPDTMGFSPLTPLSILKSISWQMVLSTFERVKRVFTRKKRRNSNSTNRQRKKNATKNARNKQNLRKPSFAEGLGRLISQRSRSIITSNSNNSTTTSASDDYYYNENDHSPNEGKPWRGLARYNIYYGDDNNPDVSDNVPLDEFVEEYGKYSTLLDAADGSITYYYDIPGKVMDTPESCNPQWGVDMSFTSSTIHYGPWADRQRVFIQNLLFPRSFFNSVPEPTRIKGQVRLGREFKLFIEFNEDVILRLPTREPSKNSEFYSNYKEDPTTNSLRAFGWIELKARHLSTISFTAALVANSNGWMNDFRMDLNHPELRTSVNHGLVFAADHHTIQSDMSSPLQWNGLQLWNFQFTSKNVQTFFLREHVSLLTDLVNDFSSGPPVAYNEFIPFRYEIKWSIIDYGIFLNVNDRNIINNPSDFDDNTFVSFQGEIVDIDIVIPMEQVSGLKNRVDFKITVSDLTHDLNLCSSFLTSSLLNSILSWMSLPGTQFVTFWMLLEQAGVIIMN